MNLPLTPTRALRAALVTVLLLATSLFTAAAVATVKADAPTVTFTVDHAAKTITVSVKLAFFVRPALTKNDPRLRQVNAAVQHIRADIAAFWGNQFFLCYAVKVQPTLRVVDDSSQVAQGEVGIRLFPQAVSVRGFDVVDANGANVTGVGSERYLSETPADRVEPQTGPPPTDPDTGEPVESRWPLNGTWGVYSHELGHMLGLNDNYDTSGEFSPSDGYAPTLRGAADDMMRLQGQPLDPTSMTRLIRRSGQVDEKSLKCAMTADMPTAILGLPGALGGTVAMHIWTCQLAAPSNGPLATRGRIQFTGTFDLSGGISSPFGSAQGSATVSIAPTLIPGDLLFTALYENGQGRVEVNQAITWVDGRPRATFSYATLSKTLTINSRVVFTDGAKECP